MPQPQALFSAPLDLKQALSETAPDALLVPPRILRRVIKEDRGLRGLSLGVPHRKTYAISAETLVGLATPHELDLPLRLESGGRSSSWGVASPTRVSAEMA